MKGVVLKGGLMETWWCFKCAKPQILRCIPGASEVRCPKGHKMKHADTPQQIAHLKSQEGVV